MAHELREASFHVHMIRHDFQGVAAQLSCEPLSEACVLELRSWMMRRSPVPYDYALISIERELDGVLQALRAELP